MRKINIYKRELYEEENYHQHGLHTFAGSREVLGGLEQWDINELTEFYYVP